jgi:nicotinate-nucleotide adenylyltransferase
MKSIALLGGSFNPPHIGHLQAAVYLRSVMAVNEVWLVPSFHHPFGKPLTSFEHRVAMCQRMADDYSTWLKVSLVESQVGGEGRTIELLHHLLPKYADTSFSFVIGTDIVADLPKWKSWNEIQALVKVIVLNRAGHPDSSGIGPPMIEISSSEIRESVKCSKSVSALVPKDVDDYIKQHQLFL